MAHLYRATGAQSLYTDRKFEGGKDAWTETLQLTTTLYIGNLSFYTTEEQLYEFFGRAGEVKRIVMGLDRHKRTPCGFCFVEYFKRAHTEAAVNFLNGLKLDERIVRVDWDAGFTEGRQYGRGRSGGQVRDEYRADFDPARGGWGKAEDNERLLHQQRRRSFEPRDYRGGGGRRERTGDDEGRDMAPIRQQPAEEPHAKRSRVEAEANPRFREEKGDDDEDDD